MRYRGLWWPTSRSGLPLTHDAPSPVRSSAGPSARADRWAPASGSTCWPAHDSVRRGWFYHCAGPANQQRPLQSSDVLSAPPRDPEATNEPAARRR